MWRLCRYTVLVGALDSNTDSNTRQRDLCNLDAMLASRYQGAVAALAAEHPRRQVANLQSNLPSNLPSNSSIEPSEHPRRQVAATLSTPQAFTNDRTLEFNMATVAAVYFHALEYSDYANNSGTATAESVAACFFFQDLGACRRRMPRARADLKVPEDASCQRPFQCRPPIWTSLSAFAVGTPRNVVEKKTHAREQQ